MKKTSQGTVRFDLPGQTITVGPGTVPTSGTSISTTSIKQISSDLKEVSKLKIFSFKEAK